ncbi:hypothetical protein L1887_03646 [Cichorium endivia]|nr:hypothetical protein L1887_03646 [Cichorium endivia]
MISSSNSHGFGQRSTPSHQWSLGQKGVFDLIKARRLFVYVCVGVVVSRCLLSISFFLSPPNPIIIPT